jgi:single-strand DNA-binding protein
MFNEAQLSVVGYVANEPEYSKIGNGIPKLTMKVAWTTRRREPATGEWVDGNTSFVRVTCWRRLADNLATCLRKGDPVLLRGRLDVRPFTGKDGVRRVSVDVEAHYLGHDLSRGVAGFRRVWETTGKTAEQAAADNGPDGDGSTGSEAAMAVMGGGGPGPAAGNGLADDSSGRLAGNSAGALADDSAGGPADEEIFDDSAIEALAADSGSVTTPS